MSKAIDEKVVEMRFDNKDFESNIKDTMKTLEQFKKQLKFDGASEGLENISKQAGKVNLNGLSEAVETVKVRFSALEVIAITALTNITNRAIQAGERILKAFTITPVMDGLKEYELQIDSVQTIMANTGDSVDKVNEKLDELNEYADLTIYNFSEMTRNVGTFTAALGKGSLETSTRALKGIGNWAAYAGASSEDMARASQYLAQGLQSGYISLRTWYTVMHTRGMAGENFREAFKQTAREVGINVDAIIEKAGSFNDSLQEGWLNTEVFMKTMDKFAADPAMTDAATKIKTFSQLVSVIKEALGTGWAETWRYIIGDFEQAKETFSQIGDFLTGPEGIITRISKARNDLIKSAMGKTIGEFAQKFKDLVKPIENSANSVKEVINSVQDYTKIVDEIISGKWGNGESRWNKLTEAGYDWAHAQNLVNERLGSSVRHATDFSEKQEELVKSEEKVSEATSKYIDELANLSREELKAKGFTEQQIREFELLKSLADSLGLSVGELVDKSDKLNGRYMLIESFANIGRSLITIFSSLGKAFRDAFPPITADTLFNIITGMYRLSNIVKNYVDRNAENLTRTFRGLFSVLSVIANIVKGVLRVGFKALEVILGIFGKTSEGVLDVTANLGDILTFISNILNKYIITAFDKVINLIDLVINTIKKLIFSNETLISVFNFVRNGFHNIIESIKSFLSNSDGLNNKLSIIKTNIINVVTNIKKWIEQNTIISKSVNKLKEILTNTKNGIIEFIHNNEKLNDIFGKIKIAIDNTIESFKNFINSFKNTNGIGYNIIEGLVNGLKGGIKKVVEIIILIANKIKETFCKLLGINSPSTVFYEYGTNIIFGLINGISNMFPKLKQIFKNIYETIKNISFEQISSIIWPLTSIIPQLKFLDLPRQFLNLFKACGINSLEGLKQGLQGSNGVLATITDLAKKIIEKFKSIFQINSPSKVFIAIGGFIIAGLVIGLKDSFPKVTDTIKSLFDKVVETIKKIDLGKVLAIGLGAGLLFTINNLMKTLNNFAALANRVTAPLKGLGDALSGIGKMFSSKGEAAKIKAKGSVIRNIALSIALIAGSIYILGKLEKDELIRAGIAVGIITVIVSSMYGLISLLSKKFPGTDIAGANKSVNSLVKIAGSVLLLALAIKTISKIEINEQSITNFAILGVALFAFAQLIRTSMLAGQNADKAGSMLLKISIALLIMTKVIKDIAKINESDLKKGIGAMTIILGIFGVLIIISSLAGEFSKNTGSMITKISASILLIIVAIKLISKMDESEIKKGLIVISGIVAIFAALIIISSIAGEFGKDAGSMISKMSASVLMIAAAMKIISSMSESDIKKGIAVISGIGVLFGVLIALTHVAGANASKAGLMLLEMSGALLVVVGVLFLLSKIDDKDLWRSVGIVTILEALFGGLIFVSKFAKDVKGTIITLTACLVILIGAIALLTLLDQNKLKNATACVSLVIGMFSVFVGLSKFAGSFVKVLGTLAALELAMLGLIGILYLMEKANLESAIENSKVLSLLLLSMSAVLGILTLIGLGGPAALIGIGSLLALITALGTALVGIGALVNKFPQIEEFINKGETIFVKLGSILGEFIGSIIAGIADSLLDLLPKIGNKLSEFMTNLTPFLVGIKSVDNNTLKGASFLALSIIELTTAELLAGITGFITKGDAFSKLGKDLMNFMMYAMPFFTMVSTIKPETLQGVKNLSDAMLSITKAEMLQGIANFLGLGNGTLSDFGSQLKDLGLGLNNFVNELKDFSQDTVSNKVEPACDAVKKLAEANKVVGNSGGLLGFIVGNNDLDDFGSQLKGLGLGLNNFVNELKDFSQDSVESKIAPACDAVVKIAEAGKNVQNSGGLLGFIVGNNDLDDFGNQLKALGKGLSDFVIELNGFNSQSLAETVIPACNAVKYIADLGNSLSNGDWFNNLIGKSDLEKFSTEIPKLGKGVNGFIVALGEFSSDKLAVINSACEAIQTIAGLGYIDLATLSTNLSDFGTKLISFGSSISVFVTDIANLGMDTIAESISKVQQLINMASNIATISVESIAVFSQSLVQFATEGVTGFCEAFSGFEPVERATTAVKILLETVLKKIDSYRDKFYKSFEELMKSSIEGMKSKYEELINTINNMCNDVVNAIRAKSPDMEAAGAYFVDGFVIGIRNNTFKAKIEAEAMAKAALEAARQAIDSNSPSKETMKLGNYFGEGFVVGIKDYFSKVYNTAFDSGELAKNGLNDAIDKINNILSDNMNVQPVITPVLDLSNVKSGMSNLNSLLNSDSINSNLSAINNLNSQNQNGGNNTLSAIEKLANDLKMGSGNTWNIYTQELDSDKLRQIVDYVANEFGKVYN